MNARESTSHPFRGEGGFSLIEAMVMGGHPDRAKAFVKTATGATEAKLIQTYRAALARRHALAGEVREARELMHTFESAASRRQVWYALVDGQFRAGNFQPARLLRTAGKHDHVEVVLE